MFITAFNVEKPQSLILELPEKKARYILEQFDHDLEAMAACLTVEKDQKLILLNPNYTGRPDFSARKVYVPNNNRAGQFHTLNLASSEGMPVSELENSAMSGGKDVDDYSQRVQSHMVVDSAGVGTVEEYETEGRNVKTSQEMHQAVGR